MIQTALRFSSLLVMCLASQFSLSATISYEASLSGAAENPANLSPGIGLSQIIYDSLTHSLSLHVEFSDLMGSTTAAHIHCCTAAPGNAGVASTVPTFPGFPLGATSGTYDQSFDLTDSTSWNALFVSANGGSTAGAETALIAGLNQGEAYLNIHTNQFPAGEIRGFYQRVAIPEPTTAALLGIGLIALRGSNAGRRSMKIPE